MHLEVGNPDQPTDAQHHLNQAYVYEDEGEFEKALAECDAAIEIAPSLAEIHNLRGIVLEDSDRKEEAVEAYKEAIRLDPEFHEAVDNLSELESELGERPPLKTALPKHDRKPATATWPTKVGRWVSGFVGFVVWAGIGGSEGFFAGVIAGTVTAFIITPLLARSSRAAGTRYASFWERAVAFTIDFFLFCVLSFLVSGLVGVIASALLGDALHTSVATILALLVMIVSAFVTFVIPLRLWKGQTLGKRLLGIVVVNESGRDISWGQSFARLFLYIVSYLPVFLGFLWCIWDSRKRCFHDMIAHTLVVKKGTAPQMTATLAKPPQPAQLADEKPIEAEVASGGEELELSLQQRQEIYLDFSEAEKREMEAAQSKVLNEVIVWPGQNPYEAANLALLRAEADGTIESESREAALKKVAGKYHLSRGQLLRIIREAKAGEWGS